MANLNLIPNPKVVSVLFVVFMANIYVIKTFILKPFLKLKEKRDQLTVGSQDEAKSLISESEKMIDEIKSNTDSVIIKIKATTDAILNEALKTQDQIIGDASKTAQQSIVEVKNQLQKQFTAEMKNINTYSDKLVPQIFEVLVKQ